MVKKENIKDTSKANIHTAILTPLLNKVPTKGIHFTTYIIGENKSPIPKNIKRKPSILIQNVDV